jgi:integrase
VLGKYPEMLVQKARKDAIAALGDLAKGVDVNASRRQKIAADEAERAKKSLTLERMWNEYIERREADTPPPKATTKRDWDASKERLEEGQLWKRPLAEITADDLDAEFSRLCKTANKKKAVRGGKTQAAATLRYARAAVNEAIRKHFNGMFPNPFIAFNSMRRGWYRAEARTRTVGETEEQLKLWWDAVEGLRKDEDGRARAHGTISDYLLLSLLWGGRKTEVLSLRWENVDLRGRVVVFKDTKNRKDHEFPLTPYAEKILERRRAAVGESEWVFPAPRKSKSGFLTEPKIAIADVIKASGVQFSAHDLRRTFATALSKAGAGAHIIDMALNHTPLTTAGKHYSPGIQKVRVLRPFYEKAETLLLEEAGVIKPS